MRSRFIVLPQPGVKIGLQLLERAVHLLAERHSIELVERRLVEAFADAVGLRALGLGSAVVDVLDREIELVLVPFGIAAIFAAGSVSTRSSLASCSSKNGSTRSFNRSAAVIGVLRS